MSVDARTATMKLVRACLEIKFSERNGTRDRSFTEMAQALLERRDWSQDGLSNIANDPKVFASHLVENDEELEEIFDLLSEVESASSKPVGTSSSEKWKLPARFEIDNRGISGQYFNMEMLSDCAETYSSMHLESREFERWICSHLIYGESQAFTSRLAPFAKKKLGAQVLTTLVGLIKWGVGVGASISIADQYGGGAGLVAFVIWITALSILAKPRIEADFRLARAYTSAVNAFTVMTWSRPSPEEAAKALLHAEAADVVWPRGLWPIVFKARMRDPISWRPSR